MADPPDSRHVQPEPVEPPDTDPVCNTAGDVADQPPEDIHGDWVIHFGPTGELARRLRLHELKRRGFRNGSEAGSGS